MTLELPPLIIQAPRPHDLDVWSQSLTVVVEVMKGNDPTPDNQALLGHYDRIRREVDAARFGGGFRLAEGDLWLVEIALQTIAQVMRDESAALKLTGNDSPRPLLQRVEVALAEVRALQIHLCPAYTVQA